MKRPVRLWHIVVAVMALTAVTRHAGAATVYGVAVENGVQRLVTWDSAAPGTILSDVPITGLPPGETIRGIDFDPAYFPGNQRLFAIGAGSDQFANVYRLGFNSSIAGVTKLPPSAAPPADATGQNYGVSSAGSTGLFSVTDAARLAGYAISSNSGSGAGTLVYASGDPNEGQTPHPVHLFNGLIVDTGLDILAEATLPGSPRPLSTIGPLGADFDDAGAIDAATENSTDTVYAALLPAGQSQSNFYVLNQQTGAAMLVGPIGGGLLITAMAVEPPGRPVPEPAAAKLLAISLGCYCLHQRTRHNVRRCWTLRRRPPR